MTRITHRLRMAAAIAASAATAAIGLAVLSGGTAYATACTGSTPTYTCSATVTLSGGSLAFVSAPADLSWSTTLTGLDQTLTDAESFDVSDATGSGDGWNITLTSTQFNDGSGDTLPDDTVTVPSKPTVTCDTDSTCNGSATEDTGPSYPYTVPAAVTPPAATKMFDQAADYGMGDQTVAATFQVVVPGDAYAHTYTSTWTVSLVSGP